MKMLAAALTFARRVLATRARNQRKRSYSHSCMPAFQTERSLRSLPHVALNVLTNYFNKATEVDIDFPIVSFRNAN